MLVQALLIWQGYTAPNSPMGDLTFAYQPWVDQFFASGQLLGVSAPWVYPFLAFAPMLLAELASPSNLQLAWVIGQAVLMLATLVLLVSYRVKNESDRQARFVAGYAWVLFSLVLGPVAISRIDTFSVLLAVVAAVAIISGSQATAAAWFTVAGFIKVWPVALFLPLLAGSKDWRKNLAVASLTFVSIIAIGFLLGGNESLFSFITGQTARGIQIESPVATPWLWLGLSGSEQSGLFYSNNMMTFEVFGPLVAEVSALMTLVQLGAILITVALIFLAKKAGADFGQILTWGALTATLDLIVFNKVGSPQFIYWLAVPLMLGLLYRVPNWLPAVVMIFASALVTQLVYPWLYSAVLSQDSTATAVLLVRNLLEIAALVYANVMLTKLGSKPRQRT